MAREFIVPGEIISGSGALDMAENALKLLGKKALIVTDKVMIDLGNCAKVEKALTNQGIAYSIYSDICGEPTDTMIEKGLQIYKDENCDFLVALGGGSPIDSMKAIGSLVVNGGSISDYMGKVIDVKMPPMAAIPTTAGTGSEATQFTIITDTKKDIKMLLKGKVLMPDLAIIDPQFTMTAPPKITAATGLDALCHCVEAYTSPSTASGPSGHPSAQKKETPPFQCLPSGIVYSFLIYISVNNFSLSGSSPLNNSRNKIITGSYPCILASCPIRK